MAPVPRRISHRLLLSAALIGGMALATAEAQAKVRWFHSPTGNIQCEVAGNGDVRGTYAYCQTFKRAKSIRLRRSGAMRVCRGIGCLGNGPENAFTLRYGRSVTVGPFRCTSLERGMRCKVIRSGHGFLISKQRIRRF